MVFVRQASKAQQLLPELSNGPGHAPVQPVTQQQLLAQLRWQTVFAVQPTEQSFLQNQLLVFVYSVRLLLQLFLQKLHGIGLARDYMEDHLFLVLQVL